MRLNHFVVAAAMTLAFSSASLAAQPAAPKLDQDLLGTQMPILVARDCHRDSERHYLSDYDARIWHHHVGRHCRIVLDEDPPRHHHHHYDNYPHDEGCVIMGTAPFTFRFCPD